VRQSLESPSQGQENRWIIPITRDHSVDDFVTFANDNSTQYHGDDFKVYFDNESGIVVI
jgi:hypothetical protein